MYDHNEHQNISFFFNNDNNLEAFQQNNPITTIRIAPYWNT